MSISEHKHMLEPVRRIEVFTGAGRRRSWSSEEKASIIAESYGEGGTACAVARRHGLTPQQLSPGAVWPDGQRRSWRRYSCRRWWGGCRPIGKRRRYRHAEFVADPRRVALSSRSAVSRCGWGRTNPRAIAAVIRALSADSGRL
jgi:transposase-like protein